jgi:hypothetical protein
MVPIAPAWIYAALCVLAGAAAWQVMPSAPAYPSGSSSSLQAARPASTASQPASNQITSIQDQQSSIQNQSGDLTGEAGATSPSTSSDLAQASSEMNIAPIQNIPATDANTAAPGASADSSSQQSQQAQKPAAQVLTSNLTGSDTGPVSKAWESTVRYYSGGGYGVELINKNSTKTGNGGYPNDRAIVQAAAAKYRIPFRLLWGTYGSESSWGKNTGGESIPPYFGLTWHYPKNKVPQLGPKASKYLGTSGNFRKDAEEAARTWLKNYKLKNGGQAPA